MNDAFMGTLMISNEVKLEDNPVGFGNNPPGFPL